MYLQMNLCSYIFSLVHIGIFVNFILRCIFNLRFNLVDHLLWDFLRLCSQMYFQLNFCDLRSFCSSTSDFLLSSFFSSVFLDDSLSHHSKNKYRLIFEKYSYLFLNSSLFCELIFGISVPLDLFCHYEFPW